MLLFLFLLSNTFVTVIVDIEMKQQVIEANTKLLSKTDYYNKANEAKEKKKMKSTELNESKKFI